MSIVGGIGKKCRVAGGTLTLEDGASMKSAVRDHPDGPASGVLPFADRRS